MTWDLMLLLVHLPFLLMAILLYRGSPCWLQKFVMAGLVFTMALVCLGYLIRATGAEWGGGIMFLGLLCGHLSNLVLLWRLTWQNPEWKLSSARSLPSPAR